MANIWQDSVTPEEWQSWKEIAQNSMRGTRDLSGLGREDIAAQVIEKLLQLDNRPENVPAWVRTVTRNLYIDSFRRHQNAHLQIDDIDALDKSWEYAIRRRLTDDFLGTKTRFQFLESVNELLGFLTPKEQKMILLSAGGFSPVEIAEEMEYPRVETVEVRLSQIREKIKTELKNRDEFRNYF